MTNVDFDMTTGRPVVSGNTNDFTKVMDITFTNARFKIDLSHHGLLRFNKDASVSIDLSLAGSTKMWNTNGNAGTIGWVDVELLDFITVFATNNYTTNQLHPQSAGSPVAYVGMGKFVNYDQGTNHFGYTSAMTCTSVGLAAQDVDP